MAGKIKEGRPTVMTPEVLRKLEEAFAIGCSDVEACVYADIWSSTLYDYQKANPKFAERRDQLRERPVLKARQTVVKNLDAPEHAKWYLERKKKLEFGAKDEGLNLGSVTINILNYSSDGNHNPTQLFAKSLPASGPSGS